MWGGDESTSDDGEEGKMKRVYAFLLSVGLYGVAAFWGYGLCQGQTIVPAGTPVATSVYGWTSALSMVWVAAALAIGATLILLWALWEKEE